MSDSIFKFELGAKAKDNISGFTGTVTGRTEYMTGCKQYLVEASSKENAPAEAQWIDEGRLDVIQEAKPIPEPETRGGPHPTPPARRV